MPRISIIIPVYNSEKYIGEAIESLLNQTYRNFELIIIDDCSKDKSAQIIQQYKDERIVFVKNEINQGFLYGLNYGISIAKGEYIARLDDDDISYPTRLEKQIKYMDDHRDVVLLGTKKDLLINDEKIKDIERPIVGAPEIKFSLLWGNYVISHSSFMMRKDIINNNNIKYEIFKQTPDHHMLLTMCRYGKIDRIEEPLVAWRIHAQQSTQVRSMKMKMGEEDRTRLMYIDTLDLPETEKDCLKKAILRSLENSDEYELFQKVFEDYACDCGIDTTPGLIEKNKCLKYLFTDICIQQKHNMLLLKNYMSSPFCDIKWLMKKQGIEFIIKCILKYNKNWIGPIKEE